MKYARCFLLSGSILAITGVDTAQSSPTSSEFFNPDFRARRPGVGGLLVVTTDLTSPAEHAENGMAGDVMWTHRAKGLVEVGVVLAGNLQLYSYTETVGDSLVFGRGTQATDLLGGALSTIPGSLSGPVLSQAVLNSWSATAELSNLNLMEGERYTLSLDVETGGGLPVTLLDAAEFSVTSGGNPLMDSEGHTVLDLLTLVSIGAPVDSGRVDFTFDVPMGGIDSLSVDLRAATAAGVDLFGGTDNHVVLRFLDFELMAVPEPSTSLTALLGGVLLASRRRRAGG